MFGLIRQTTAAEKERREQLLVGNMQLLAVDNALSLSYKRQLPSRLLAYRGITAPCFNRRFFPGLRSALPARAVGSDKCSSCLQSCAS